MTYVVYLNTNRDSEDKALNAYGYWTGKSYTVQGEVFPITDNTITHRTKIYQSEKTAENAINKCLLNYSYVCSGHIEENLVV